MSIDIDWIYFRIILWSFNTETWITIENYNAYWFDVENNVFWEQTYIYIISSGLYWRYAPIQMGYLTNTAGIADLRHQR